VLVHPQCQSTAIAGAYNIGRRLSSTAAEQECSKLHCDSSSGCESSRQQGGIQLVCQHSQGVAS
jgi:hypothetical protein